MKSTRFFVAFLKFMVRRAIGPSCRDRVKQLAEEIERDVILALWNSLSATCCGWELSKIMQDTETRPEEKQSLSASFPDFATVVLAELVKEIVHNWFLTFHCVLDLAVENWLERWNELWVIIAGVYVKMCFVCPD